MHLTNRISRDANSFQPEIQQTDINTDQVYEIT